MKSKHSVPAVTSLPQSPREESDHRVRNYVITMTIRVVCFILMAVVQPYSWYTWVFAAAAAFLPYFAVVIANAGSDNTTTTAESPMQELDAPRPEPLPDSGDPSVITIRETREDER